MSENETGTTAVVMTMVAVVLIALVVLGTMSFGMMGGGMMGGGLGVGLVFLLVPVALLLWLAFYQEGRRELERPERPFQPGPGGEYPLQILDRKLANGELTRTEYETLRQEILRQ